MMKTVVQENKDMKGHIANLEKKLDYHLATGYQINTHQPTHLTPPGPKSPPPLLTQKLNQQSANQTKT